MDKIDQLKRAMKEDAEQVSVKAEQMAKRYGWLFVAGVLTSILSGTFANLTGKVPREGKKLSNLQAFLQGYEGHWERLVRNYTAFKHKVKD